jgi:serine/threonine protein kinase
MSSVPGKRLARQPKELFGYEILDFLGEGAHSVIYAAASPGSKQLCAIKYVVIRSPKEDRFYEQLENEINVGQFANHRGIRHSIELKSNRDSSGRITDAALVMEFFDGVPMGKRLKASIQTVVKIFIHTANALAALHQAGFIHCDLKPGNILVNDRRDVRVIDLGQACRIGTRKPRIQGTPGYMAPEQAARTALTRETDIFNFGATLYNVLCQLCVPSAVERDDPHSNEPTVPPHMINPEIPQSLSDLIMECIRPDPARRPRDMDAVIQRLEETRDVAARHRKPHRRHKKVDVSA